MNDRKRFQAACRRFGFELLRAAGIFAIIQCMPGYAIKEPWNTLYKRAKIKKKNH